MNEVLSACVLRVHRDPLVVAVSLDQYLLKRPRHRRVVVAGDDDNIGLNAGRRHLDGLENHVRRAFDGFLDAGVTVEVGAGGGRARDRVEVKRVAGKDDGPPRDAERLAPLDQLRGGLGGDLFSDGDVIVVARGVPPRSRSHVEVADDNEAPEAVPSLAVLGRLRYGDLLARRRDHRLDALADAWASLRLELDPHAVQGGDDRLPRLSVGGHAFPARRLAGGDLVAAHIRFDVREQVLDGLDPPARRASLKHVAVAALRHLFGVGGRLRRGRGGGGCQDAVG